MSFKKTLTDTLLILFFAMFVGALIATAVSIRIYRSYAIDSKEWIMNNKDKGLVLLDRNGQMFFAFDQSRYKTFVPLSEIPIHMRQAVVAVEDKEFLRHRGFSIRGIARSVYLNYKNRQVTHGGSTITQQLVKNSLLTPQKSYSRKIQEVVLAIKLERHYSKADILEMYLNSVYFGQGVIGIEEAAQSYFRKHAKDLTLAEASLLAGLLPAPANLSPISGSAQASQSRQEFVLRNMQSEGFISEEEKLAAREETITLNDQGNLFNNHAPHFALMVRDELINRFGEEVVVRAGLTVTTTIDLSLQKFAERAVREHIKTISDENASNGSAVIIDPHSGEVLALVGSANWHDQHSGKINMATSPRQSGSAFKPIVYATAFNNHTLTPSTILQDTPRTFGRAYRPVNYDRRYRGPITVRSALASSLNIPAVDALTQTGITSVVETSRKMGITTITDKSDDYLSLALGSEGVSLLDLTSAYATLANSGLRHNTKTILEIKDKYNTPVDTEDTPPVQAIEPEAAFLVSSILSDHESRKPVFGEALTISQKAAAKTGTTQGFRDGWTVGYTPDITIGVWVGNSDNTPMRNLPGALGAAPLWRTLMEHALQNIPEKEFLPPQSIVAATICHGSGLLAPPGSNRGYTEYYIKGTEPTRYCPTPTPRPIPPEIPPAEELHENEGVETPPAEDEPKEDIRQAQNNPPATNDTPAI